MVKKNILLITLMFIVMMMPGMVSADTPIVVETGPTISSSFYDYTDSTGVKITMTSDRFITKVTKSFPTSMANVVYIKSESGEILATSYFSGAEAQFNFIALSGVTYRIEINKSYTDYNGNDYDGGYVASGQVSGTHLTWNSGSINGVDDGTNFYNIQTITTEPLPVTQDVSSCQTLSSRGTYTLTQSIGSGGACIIIDADYVTINGNGYTIDGNVDASGTALGVNAQTGLVLNNVIVTGNALTNGYTTNIEWQYGTFAGSINVVNSTISTIDARGGGSNLYGGRAGGTVYIDNSNVTIVNASGGKGGAGGYGGNVNFSNSNVSYIDARGGSSGYDGLNSYSGQGGNVIGINSTSISIDASVIGGYTYTSWPYYYLANANVRGGGFINLTNVNAVTASANGGVGRYGNGGVGGTIVLDYCNINDISANGGSAGTAGRGGYITIFNSDIINATAFGSNSANGGFGGAINVTNTTIETINVSGGVGTSLGGVGGNIVANDSTITTIDAHGSNNAQGGVVKTYGTTSYTNLDIQTNGIIVADSTDSTIPTLSFNDGTSSGYVKGLTSRLNLSLADETELNNVIIQLKTYTGTLVAFTNVDIRGNVSTNIYAEINATITGRYFFDITLYDSSGNPNTLTSGEFTLDNNIPYFNQFYTLTNDSFWSVSDNNIPLSFNAADNGGGVYGSAMSNVTFYIYNASDDSSVLNYTYNVAGALFPICYIGGGNSCAGAVFVTLPEGNYYLVPEACDRATNCFNSTPIYITVELPVCNGSNFPCQESGALIQETESSYVLFNNIQGTIYVNDIIVGVDFVYVDSGSVANVPASIEFSGVPDGYVPYRDGFICPPEYCSNIQLIDGVLTFDVTGFSNYSYGPSPIYFAPPTDETGSIYRNYILSNVTATDSNGVSNITTYLYNSTDLVNSSFAEVTGGTLPTLPSNLILDVSMMTDATDSSGNSFDGTVNGATHTDNCIGDKGCYTFDGSDYIAFPDNSFTTSTTSEFTFIVAAKPSDTTTRKAIFADNPDASPGWFTFTFENDGHIYISTGDGVGCDGGLYNANEWYRLAYTYTSTPFPIGTLYNNGTQLCNFGAGEHMDLNAWGFGRRDYGPDMFWLGQLTDLQIYDSDIGASAIADDYAVFTNTGTGVSTTLNSFSNFTDLPFGEYQLNATTFNLLGNESYTETMNVSYQNSPPTIDSFFPITNITTGTYDGLEWYINASDVDGQTLNYEWYIDGVSQSNNANLFETNVADVGVYNISVSVSDGIANVNQEWTLTIEEDLLPPTLLFTGTTDGSVKSNYDLNLSASCVDDSGVASISVTLRNTIYEPTPLYSLTNSSGGDLDFIYDLSAAWDAWGSEYWIVYTCVDNMNNSIDFNPIYFTTNYCDVCNETCSPCGGGCSATDFSNMFTSVSDFDATYGDITGWDTSCVTNMYEMFASSDFNQNISGWDTSSVTDMAYMFAHSPFNQPIGNWDVSNVNNMESMFEDTEFNQNISSWNTSSVTTMAYMFVDYENNSLFNQDLGGWDVRNLQIATDMFGGVNLSVSNYDSLLNGWSPIVTSVGYTGVIFGVGNSMYSVSGESARAELISNDWVITDGGLYTPSNPPENLTINLSENLLSHYKYENNANDETGKYNGTVTGATYTPYGSNGGAYSYDRDGDYVNNGRMLELEGAENLTISVWFTAGDMTGSPAPVLFGRMGDYPLDMWAGLGTNNEYFYFQPNGLLSSNTYFPSSLLNLTGGWNHLVIVFNGSGSTNEEKVQMYLNNESVTVSFDSTVSSVVSDNTANMYIGSHGRALGIQTYDWNGTIDELRFYTDVKTPEFVSVLYGDTNFTTPQVNQTPVIDSYTPTDLTPGINTIQTQDFEVVVSDADNDTLTYEWYVDGVAQTHNFNTFTANGTELGVGNFNVSVEITDTLFVVSQEWGLYVVAAPTSEVTDSFFDPIDHFDYVATNQFGWGGNVTKNITFLGANLSGTDATNVLLFKTTASSNGDNRTLLCNVTTSNFYANFSSCSNEFATGEYFILVAGSNGNNYNLYRQETPFAEGQPFYGTNVNALTNCGDYYPGFSGHYCYPNDFVGMGSWAFNIQTVTTKEINLTPPVDANPSISFVSPTDSTGTQNRSYILSNVTASDISIVNLTTYLYNSTELINSTFVSTEVIDTNFDFVNGNYDDTIKRGMKFVANKNATFVGAIKDSLVTATTAYLMDASQSVLETSTFVGDLATFNTSITQGSTYYIVVDSGGAFYNIRFTGTISLPKEGTNINWTADYFGSEITVQAENIMQIITLNDGLNLESYNNYSNLPDGTYYLNATAYDSLGQSNSTETRTIVIDTYVQPTPINWTPVWNYTTQYYAGSPGSLISCADTGCMSNFALELFTIVNSSEIWTDGATEGNYNKNIYFDMGHNITGNFSFVSQIWINHERMLNIGLKKTNATNGDLTNDGLELVMDTFNSDKWKLYEIGLNSQSLMGSDAINNPSYAGYKTLNITRLGDQILVYWDGVEMFNVTQSEAYPIRYITFSAQVYGTGSQGMKDTMVYTDYGLTPIIIPQELPTFVNATNGLIGCYDMNEASGTLVMDAFGLHNGTATGTSVVAGVEGNARYFGGYTTEDEISIDPALFSQLPMDSNWSITGYVKLDGLCEDGDGPDGCGKVFWIQDTSDNVPYVSFDLSNFNNGNVPYIDMWDGSSEPYANGNGFVGTEWVQFAVVYDKTNDITNVYLDGVLNFTTTTNNMDYSEITVVGLGRLLNSGSHRILKGSMDMMNFWDTALTANTIADFNANRTMDCSDLAAYTEAVPPVNQTPVINSYTPIDLTPEISMKQNLSFSLTASDNENDILYYQWFYDGDDQNEPFSTFQVQGNDGVGVYTITGRVNDSLTYAEQSWTVTIIENYAPTINSFTPVDTTPTITTLQTQAFSVSASDVDDSILSYEWYVNGTPLSRNLSTYTAIGNNLGVGTYNITNVVTDGTDTDSQEWILSVELPENTPPSINSFTPADTTPEITNVQTQQFTITVVDADNDELTYEWYVNGTARGVNLPLINLNGGTFGVGTYNVTAFVRETNNESHNDSQEWTLSVILPPNAAPTIDSYTPLNLLPYITVEQSQTFTITASDDENETLTYAWYVNGTTQNVTLTTLNLSGSVLGVGTYVVMATVNDTNNNMDSQSWTLNVETAAPTIVTIDLQPIIISPQSHIVGSCIAVGNGMLNVNYQFYRNGVVYEDVTEYIASGEELSVNLGATLVEGDVWYFRCNAMDNLNRTSGWSQSTNRTVLPNGLPVVTTTLGTPIYDNGDTLPVYCSATDINGDNVTFTQFRVFREGLLYYENVTTTQYATPTGNRLMVVITNESDFIEGEEWYAACKASDGHNETEWVNSSVATVQRDSRPPVLDYVREFPLIMFDNSTVIATAYGRDVNGDDITYVYTLYENGVAIETKSETIAQAVMSSVTFDYTPLIVGRDMIVGVAINDSEYNLTQSNTSAITVRASNNVPYISTGRMSPNVFVGNDDNIVGLCTGIDVDGDTINFNYVWYVNDVAVKSGSKVYSQYGGYASGSEITIDTLSGSVTNETDLVKFSCAAFDSISTGNYFNTSETYIYGENNLAPELKQVYIAPLSGDTFQEFNISIRTKDKDQDAQVMLEWRIVKNGLYQATQTTDYVAMDGQNDVIIPVGVIVPSQTNAGDTFYVRARAYDGFDYSGWVSSNAVTISNVAPVMLNATILNTPLENATLVSECSASDGDDQTVTFDKIWYRDGVEATTLTSVPTTLTNAGESWIVSCRAFDGVAYSSRMNSSAVVIINTASLPVISNITISGQAGLLSGNCLVTDAEGDANDFVVRFYRNMVLMDTQTRDNVTNGVSQQFNYSGNLTPGESWMFYCMATDVDGSVDDSVSIVIPSITFSHSETIEIQKITSDFTTNADSVRVSKNDVFIADTNLARYIFEGLNPNTTYNITLQPVKNGFYGSEYRFNVTTKETDNNNPTMNNVTISPLIAYTDSVLQGYCNADDVESSSVFYTYRWYVNNVIVDTGVSTLKARNTLQAIDVLPSTNILSGDLVAFSCVANDGIGSSAETFANLTVLNTPQTITEVFVESNETDYLCEFDYSDIDGDNQTNVEYTWFKNNINLGVNTSYITASGISAQDNLICQVLSTTNYHNVTANSSGFIVGDFEAPIIGDLELPSSVFTDTSYEVKVDCEDNVAVAVGYPKIAFINPNLLEREYPIFYESGISFSRFLTFSEAGEYSDIEIVCKDGNGNIQIKKYNGTITAKVRATVIGGGSGSGSGGEEEEVNVFTIIPKEQDFGLSLGQTRIIEFEIRNDLTEDVSFTAAILVDSENPETYKWMQFEGGLKAITFDIAKEGNLNTGSKFIRYYLRIPADATLGEYKGIIEVNGKEQTERYIVNIDVVAGTSSPLLNFLNFKLFEIPFTKTSITGAVVGTDTATVEGKPFKMWMGLLGVVMIAGLVVVNRKMRR